MPPFVGTLLRMAGRGGLIKDNFNRSLTGSLGVTSTGGFAWNILAGVWDVNGSRPTTATSQSSNPLAVIDAFSADGEVKVLLGTGDAMYFRVQNATNWWRILNEGYQTSSCGTCCNTCCSTCCNTCNSGRYRCSNQSCYGCGGCGCSCPSGYGCEFIGGSYSTCDYSCNCSSCNCTSCNCYSCNCTYYNNYRVKLQKMIGGALTTVHTSSISSSLATVTARVVLKEDAISTYYGAAGDTALWAGTSPDLATQTQHGIGRGSSNYNTSAMDDFEMKWG